MYPPGTYIPRPAPDAPPRVDSKGRHWWGVAFSSTAHVGPAGYSKMNAALRGINHSGHLCWFTADQWRFGPGLGGIGGGSLLLGINIDSEKDLRSALGPGPGWEFTLGANSKTFFNSLQTLHSLARYLKVEDLLSVNAKDLERLEIISDRLSYLLKGNEIISSVRDGQPALIVLPFDVGFQASVYYAMASSIQMHIWR